MAYVEFWTTSNSGQTAQRAKVRVYYTVSQSGNTSTITATDLSVFFNTSANYGYNGKTFYLDGKITFNGTTVYSSSSANANSGCGKIVSQDGNIECWVQNHKPSGSITVTHNSSGAGSFTAAMVKNRFSAFFGVNGSYEAYQFKGTGSKSVTLPTISQGPYYSWKSLGSGSTSTSISYSLSSGQVGRYSFTPSSNGTLSVSTTGASDSYGGIGTSLSLSNSQTSGDSIVTGELIDNDDSSGYQFGCSYNVTAGTRYYIFVHNYYGNADSGTLNITFTPSNYTITFNANGGSGAPSAMTCTPGGSITMPTTKPTRSGYIFLGWGLSSTSTWCEKDGLYVGGTYTPDGTRTLYAIWGYTLTINPNGGTMVSGSTSSGSTTTTTSFTVGFTKTATYGRWLGNFKGSRYLYTNTGNYCQPIRTGYTFNGWTVTAGNGSVAHSPAGTEFYSFYNDDCYYNLAYSGSTYGYYYYINNTTNPTHSTITAQWLANTYTVTYNVNGGNALSTTTKTVTYNSTYGTLPTPTRTGYTFNGWYTAASGGTKITSSSTVSTASNHTIYAQWSSATYTVTFNQNGGNTPSSSSITVTYGSTYGTLPTCSRTGYTFEGWYTATSGGTKIESTTTVNITANQTLYARWTAYTYSVKYNANGGNGTMSNSSHTYDVAKALSENTFTKFGYTFKGWATTLARAEAGTVDHTDKKSVSNLTTTNGAIVNLYAVWELYTKVYIYTNKKDGTSKWVPVTKYTYPG